MTSSEVGVVLVNHESGRCLVNRAHALRDAGFAVVVVDNSGDLPEISDVTIVDPGANVGFGAGCNLGAAVLPGHVGALCLHNPDVEATPATLRVLASRIGARVTAVAPALSTPTGLRRAGYRYPSVAREAVVSWRGMRRARTAGRAATHSRRHRPAGTSGRRFASAALLVVDRGAFEAIGGFDPDYFLYGEDLDLWHRLRLAGGAPAFAPDLTATHARGAGSRLDPGSRELLRRLGVELFAARYGRTGWRPYRVVHRRWAAPSERSELQELVEDGFRRDVAPRELLHAVRDGLMDRSAPARGR
jgi:N-acetylglucosaminyl-diphospho-decaprenol L-rhamnosyltransferase